MYDMYVLYHILINVSLPVGTDSWKYLFDHGTFCDVS